MIILSFLDSWGAGGKKNGMGPMDQAFLSLLQYLSPHKLPSIFIPITSHMARKCVSQILTQEVMPLQPLCRASTQHCLPVGIMQYKNTFMR